MTNSWSNKNLCLSDKLLNSFGSWLVPLSKMIDSPAGIKHIRAKTYKITRGQYRSCTKGYDVEKVFTGAMDGSPDGVTIVLHTPKGASSGDKLPLIIWSHGGGFIMGTAEDAYGADVFKRLKVALPADKQKFVWASIEYRMAPESPAPAAANDCINASKWLIENPPSSVDPTNVHVAGSSAGANLALVITSELVRANCASSLKSCFIDSPAVGPKCDSSTFTSNSNAFVSSNWIKNSWRLYLEHAANESALTDAESDVKVCPHLVKGALRGFPKTIVCLGKGDQLYNEGSLVVQNLENEGVECKKFVFKASHVMGLVMDPVATKAAFREYAGVF